MTDSLKLAPLVVAANDINDDGYDYEYQPYFNETAVRGRSRLVDTSESVWDIGDTEQVQVNFDLVRLDNVEVIDQFKYVFAHLLKSWQPKSAIGRFTEIKDFLNCCDIDDETYGDELSDVLSDELIGFLAGNRKELGQSEGFLNNVRFWYQKGASLGLPMFDQTVSNALADMKFSGGVKGLDVISRIPNKSPLSSNELMDLRRLLSSYDDHFETHKREFQWLVITWLFITLGLRAKQLRLLMLVDFLVNIDSETDERHYVLLVPSVKKRNQSPRDRFKKRPIPRFLGDMLEKLIMHNKAQLKVNGIDCRPENTPLIMDRRLSVNSGARVLPEFRYCVKEHIPTNAPQNLLNSINRIQRRNGEPIFEMRVFPRRLRKTFATHAAANGTPAIVLMDLLDHEDLQHVMIYYKLGANFALKINNVYREHFGTIFDYFKGTITLEELTTTNKANQVWGPANLRRLVGIGFCGKNARCRLAPPYSCYTCVKFEACNDKAVHQEVLDSMYREVDERFEKNVAPGKYEMDHIRGCQSVIARLEVAE